MLDGAGFEQYSFSNESKQANNLPFAQGHRIRFLCDVVGRIELFGFLRRGRICEEVKCMRDGLLRSAGIRRIARLLDTSFSSLIVGIGLLCVSGISSTGNSSVETPRPAHRGCCSPLCLLLLHDYQELSTYFFLSFPS